MYLGAVEPPVLDVVEEDTGEDVCVSATFLKSPKPTVDGVYARFERIVVAGRVSPGLEPPTPRVVVCFEAVGVVAGLLGAGELLVALDRALLRAELPLPDAFGSDGAGFLTGDVVVFFCCVLGADFVL